MGIDPHQFEQMQRRLRGGKGLAKQAEAVALAETGGSAVILGIDPSLRRTGYGVIRGAQSHLESRCYGSIACERGWERSRCLLAISQTLRRLVAAEQPTVCVVEGLFYAQNLKTALVMGEARGAALAALAESGVAIFEIAPRRVKQAIVGYGAAGKGAVAKMVQRMLCLPEMPEPDAADALALALAYSQQSKQPGLSARVRI